ncbi:hypothetical protein ACOMHN_016395 [Nucella lapillus]
MSSVSGWCLQQTVIYCTVPHDWGPQITVPETLLPSTTPSVAFWDTVRLTDLQGKKKLVLRLFPSLYLVERCMLDVMQGVDTMCPLHGSISPQHLLDLQGEAINLRPSPHKSAARMSRGGTDSNAQLTPITGLGT